MAIDQNAMFRAGLSSKAKRNIEAEKSDKRIARFNTVANTAYSLLGKAALGQLSQNYQMLQKYRNKADNDVGMLGLQMDKMPKNNPGLREDLEALSKLHSEANKRANLGIGGKKRAQARQDAAGYRQQLTDLKQAMTVISTQAIEAQGMVGIDSGLVQAGGDQASMSSGASRFAQGNTIALAEGSLLQRARWNSDATKGPIGLNVLVGGEYRDGKYVDKLETGTYEKYVAAENAPIGEGDNEVERLERSKNQENNFYPLKEGGPKEAVMSREEWTKLNQENRGLISQTPWSTLKFAEKEDKTTSNNLAEYADAKIQDANSRNSLTWDQVTENEKEEFVAKMDEYTDLQFRDYFFGGGTFTASATRIPNSAPAYLFLKEEDEKNGNFKDGEFKEGFGPGNENWEGRILTLQGQSFVKGSQYRKTTAEQQWGMLGEKYKTNRKNWRIANPEKNIGISSKFETFLGNTVEIPTTQGAKEDKALIENIAADSPTVTVNGVEYERVNGAGYDYRAIKDKGGNITSGGAEVTKEYLIRSVSDIYGKIDDGYFGESTYKAPKVKFDPSSNQTTIEQMKAALPKGTNLDRSDEEIRKAYKKYVLSLAK